MPLQPLMSEDVRCPYCEDPETEVRTSIIHIGEPRECPRCGAMSERIWWARDRTEEDNEEQAELF